MYRYSRGFLKGHATPQQKQKRKRRALETKSHTRMIGTEWRDGRKGAVEMTEDTHKLAYPAPSSLPSFNVLQNRCLFLPPNPLGYYDPPAGGNQPVIVCKQTVRKPNYQLSLAFGSGFHQRKHHQACAYAENLGGGNTKITEDIFFIILLANPGVSALLQCLFFPPPPSLSLTLIVVIDWLRCRQEGLRMKHASDICCTPRVRVQCMQCTYGRGSRIGSWIP